MPAPVTFRRLVSTLAVTSLAAASLAFAPTAALTTRHVVVLDDATQDVAAAAATILEPLGLRAQGLYEHALKGFSVDLPVGAAAALALAPGVTLVEADRTFAVNAELPLGVDRTDADAIAGSKIGTGGSVDVDVAVIDTGSDASHRDLNVVKVIDCYSNGGLFGASSCIDRTGTSNTGGNDDHGHGTHVAGTVGAKDNGLDVVGVAPGARIWSVKVLGGALGSGSTSDIIAGIDYIAGTGQVEVINMSLGGSGTSTATNQAIQGAANAGVVTVVAAGNDTADAAGYTPANAPAAITVSAITDLDGKPGKKAGGSCSGSDDSLASYSNYGSTVEIAAPGSCIVSTRRGGGTTSMSGTSMASPHVAGAAALYIARNGVAKNAQRSATVLNGLLTQWSTPQTSACGFSTTRSPEPLLLLVPCGSTGGGTGNASPSVSITSPSTATTVTEGTPVTFTATASDPEDGTTAVSWSSSRDGALGTGASISRTLSVGTHTVTATTTDSAGASASATVQVTVQPAATQDAVKVGSIRWTNGSLLFGGRYVDAWVTIVDEAGATVQGASVQARFRRNGTVNNTQTASSANNGEAYFQNNNVSTGCWTVEILSVTSNAGDFDGVTPSNQYCF